MGIGQARQNTIPLEAELDDGTVSHDVHCFKQGADKFFKPPESSRLRSGRKYTSN